MTRRGLVCTAALTALTALTAAGCGGSAATGTSGESSFRHAYAAAEGGLRSVVAAIDAVAVQVGARGTNGLADRANGLAIRAAQEASALEQLGPPPRDNTGLRDVGAALNAAAADLGADGATTTGHDAASGATAAALRADAASIRLAADRMASALGLPTL